MKVDGADNRIRRIIYEDIFQCFIVIKTWRKCKNITVYPGWEGEDEVTEIKMMTGKPYLTDVPVCIYVWIRPDLQREQFEIIKKARPSKIFLISDGGRNKQEWRAIRQNRNMYEKEIDWECTLYKVFQEKNIGMYANGEISMKYIWSKVDRCIFLEDDIIPSVSFFSFCEQMLERYKDDERICKVNGLNYQEVSDKIANSYFFSIAGSSWGVATWKRVFDGRYHDFDYSRDAHILKLLKKDKKISREYYKQMLAYPKIKSYGGHPPGTEFFFASCPFLQHQLNIIPAINMIRNVGYVNSTHADDIYLMPKGIRKIFHLKSYEIDFPLSHPKYVLPDTEYEKYVNRLYAVHHPVINMYRKAERAARLLFSGNRKRLMIKLRQNIARKRNILIEK